MPTGSDDRQVKRPHWEADQDDKLSGTFGGFHRRRWQPGSVPNPERGPRVPADAAGGRANHLFTLVSVGPPHCRASRRLARPETARTSGAQLALGLWRSLTVSKGKPRAFTNIRVS